MPKHFETSHHIVMEDARRMGSVADQSIDLVITSPPYPMIQMWDDIYSAADPDIARALSQSDTREAFSRMHDLLDKVWDETLRVLKPGGIACINIGDATRSTNGHFQLFANHARIISGLTERGLSQLPTIIWRKTTNAPTKFMGSGMLPPGAYVTLEHEYILIFRNGAKRDFPQPHEKAMRRECAYFWEERNTWFSDVWSDLPGVGQKLDRAGHRPRSAAFPLDLPYRLICMFSLKGDRVLDPFLGTGTTMLAAMCAARESIGYESDAGLQPLILQKVASVPELANGMIARRLDAHAQFILDRGRGGGGLKYQNRHYNFPVMTRQEEALFLAPVRHVQYQSDHHFRIVYDLAPDAAEPRPSSRQTQVTAPESDHAPAKGRQLKLF